MVTYISTSLIWTWKEELHKIKYNEILLGHANRITIPQYFVHFTGLRRVVQKLKLTHRNANKSVFERRLETSGVYREEAGMRYPLVTMEGKQILRQSALYVSLSNNADIYSSIFADVVGAYS